LHRVAAVKTRIVVKRTFTFIFIGFCLSSIHGFAA